MSSSAVVFRKRREHLIKSEHTATFYAETCCMIIKGIVFEWALSGGKVNMHEMIDMILQTFLDSIKAGRQ